MSNFKKQIVIKVPITNEKIKTKVLTIVAKTDGVRSVAIKGPDGDRVVVIGAVDPVELTRSLRKKVGEASIVSVQNVNEDNEEASYYFGGATTSTSNSNSSYNGDQYYGSLQRPIYYYNPPQHYPYYYKVVDDSYSHDNCSIM